MREKKETESQEAEAGGAKEKTPRIDTNCTSHILVIFVEFEAFFPSLVAEIAIGYTFGTEQMSERPEYFAPIHDEFRLVDLTQLG